MFYIDLDFVLEASTVDEMVKEMRNVVLQGHQLVPVVLEAEGPGGGNPLIRLYGTKTGIRWFIINHYCKCDVAEREFYYRLILPFVAQPGETPKAQSIRAGLMVAKELD